jgi:hypothetical protein
MQSSPFSRHFIPLRSKYHPQHPVRLWKLKTKLFREMGGGNKERGVLINEKPNQGVRERKKFGNRCSGRCGSHCLLYKVKVKLSRNRPWKPIGLWDVKDPTLSRQSAHS